MLLELGLARCVVSLSGKCRFIPTPSTSCNFPTLYKNELYYGAVTGACMLNVYHKAEVNRTSVHACHVRLVKKSLGI